MDTPELIKKLSDSEQAELWMARLPKLDCAVWMIRLTGEHGVRPTERTSIGAMSDIAGSDDLTAVIREVNESDGRLDVFVQCLDAQGEVTSPPEVNDEQSGRQVLNGLLRLLASASSEEQGGDTRVMDRGHTPDQQTRVQPDRDSLDETVMAPSDLHDGDPTDEATELAPGRTPPVQDTEPLEGAPEGTQPFPATEPVGDPPRHAVGDTPMETGSDSTGKGVGLNVGSVLRNRFRITGVLGEGGMGTVFSAVDLLKEEAKDEDVNVALKIMKADLVDENMSFMGLQRETRRAQQLAHPNIVTVYDFDRAEGVIYMTMEFLRGQPLDEMLKNNPHGLDLDDARDITAQISNGLAYAHKEGIVHADLKPQNVFVLESGRAKILDFGIARAYQAKKVDVVESVFSGYSPAFASPEVMARQSPSPADDIYALGCVVYMLFTGRHPFDWASAEKAAEQGLKPKRESSFKRPEWSAVSRALSFDGSKRPKDAAEFLKRFAPSRVRQAAMSVSLASMLAAGIFIWWYEPVPGPDTPFEELPVEVQQEVTRNLEDAAMFLGYGDLDNSFQLYDAVLVAHPGNPDAIEGMQKASDEAIRMINARVEQGEISESDGRRALDALLDYETLPSRMRRQLRDARDAL